MKRTICIIFAVTLLVTLFQVVSWAELEERDDPVFGFDSITYDTETGFEWLDLTESLNMSFNEVSEQLGTGGDFEGFRYATADEVGDLFLAAGIPELDVKLTDPDSIAVFESFIDLVGITNNPESNKYYSTGITATSCGTTFDGRQLAYIFGYDNNELSPWISTKVTLSTCYALYTKYPTVGNWLVRGGAYSIIQTLINSVMQLNINTGISNSLDAKLSSALAALDDLNENNDVSAIGSLGAFIRAVLAQRGKELTIEQADDLISQAQAIIDLLS